MSYVTQEDVFNTIEPVLHGVFEEFAGDRKVSSLPFPRIPFEQSMLKYGSDKPDLRNPIVIAIPAPGAGSKPRSFFDKLNEWARSQGAGGLGYIVYEAGGAKGPIAKNLDEARIAAIKAASGAKDGDAVFFACDKKDIAAKFAGTVR